MASVEMYRGSAAEMGSEDPRLLMSFVTDLCEVDYSEAW